MTHIGLLPESVVRKNIARIIKLIEIRREFANKVPVTPIDKACLSIQRSAIRQEIRSIMQYLRRWQVNIKMCIHEN